MKKMLTFMLMCTMLLSLVTGCSGNEKPAERTPSGPDVSAPKGGPAENSDPFADFGTFKMTIGHAQAENNPRHLSLLAFKEEVESRTNDHVTIEIYSNGQLGSEKEMFEQCMAGNIQGFRGGIFDFTPRLNIFSLPFLSGSMEESAALLSCDFSNELFADAGEETGTVILSVCNSGFRQISNSKRAVKTPADLDGLLMRVNGLLPTSYAFTAMGASTVSMPLGDVYMALKTGACDGQENPWVNITGQKFQEVQQYFTEVNWQSNPDPFWVNGAWWETIPVEFQDIMREAADNASKYNDKLCVEADNAAKQAIVDAGCEIYVPTAEELKAFQDACQPAYVEAIENGVCTQEDLDHLLQALEAYRNT